MNPDSSVDRSALHNRYAGVVDVDVVAEYVVTMIGLGAIGSNAARYLTQLGFTRFRLFDGDTVAPENIGVQFYRWSDIGRLKVEALRDNLLYFMPHLSIEVYAEPYRDESLDGIVVSGVDSMQARSTIWAGVLDRIKKDLGAISLFLDGRTAGEELHLYTIRPFSFEDAQFYEKSLVPDSKTAQLPCTLQGAPHVQALMAGLIGNQIVRWLREEKPARFLHLLLNPVHLSVSKHP